MIRKLKRFSLFLFFSSLCLFALQPAKSYSQDTDKSERIKTLQEQIHKDRKFGNLEGEIHNRTRVIEINPDDGEAYYERGYAYMSQGSFDKAINDYSKAIYLKYQIEKSLYNRGAAYIQMGENNKAKEDFDSSIEMNPTSDAYANRSTYYILRKEYMSAVRDCNQAISLDDKNAKAYYNLGSSYAGMGDNRSAAKCIEQSCSLGYQRACDVMKQRFGK